MKKFYTGFRKVKPVVKKKTQKKGFSSKEKPFKNLIERPHELQPALFVLLLRQKLLYRLHSAI